MTDIIFSKQDIRRYMIHHFGLDRLDAYGEGKSGVLTYIKQVASLQQDPINIIGTNIDIILASRFSDYSPQVLTELLYQDELLIEGFDKEACLFSRDEWGQFAFARDQRVAANLRTLSYRDQDKALDYLEEVTNLLQNSPEPVSPQDLNLGRLADSSWGSSNLGNTVLYHLWCQGVAVIAERKERRKLYKHYMQAKGLANLPTFDSEADFLDWFVYRRLSGLGVYWLKSGSGWLGQSMKERKAIFQIIDKVSGQTLWWNNAFIFLITLLPFTTNWLGDNIWAHDPEILYAALFLLANLTWLCMIKNLVKVNAHNACVTKILGDYRKSYRTLLLNVLALVIAFFVPIGGLIINVLSFLLWVVPDKRIEKIKNK
ncbi:MAG: DNA glycosylase AlkZ-like family protein [Lactococcus raffinolactis]|uniref:DNA glycosylase AlkZ-like family protein n=2 Tax=Pseudolactococcus raffinolactis TaxID=1366 RepID=UPI0039962119